MTEQALAKRMQQTGDTADVLSKPDLEAAIQLGKAFLATVAGGESELVNLEVEELDLTDPARISVTFGFSRHWQLVPSALTQLTGGEARRQYRKVIVDPGSGTVLAMERA